MWRKLAAIAALGTPVIAVTVWIVAYSIAVAQMASPPCCEEGMDMAPIIVLVLAVPVLLLGSGVGGIGLWFSESRGTRIASALIAWVITLLTAVWMFVLPPIELSADKTRFGDYWPLTSASTAALIGGFILSMLPWTLVLAAVIRDGQGDRLSVRRATE